MLERGVQRCDRSVAGIVLLVLGALLSSLAGTEAFAGGKPTLVSAGREPKGLRLRWFSYTGKQLPAGVEERQLWPWGASREELWERLGERKPLCLPSDRAGILLCSFGTADAGSWYADFGKDFFEVYAEFFKGEFFSYTVNFPEEKYDFVRRTLVEALGTSGATERSTVENRFGASFDQEKVTWASSRVLVYLERRGSTVDQGSMSVVFLPISSKAPQKPLSGQAPF